jgi:two-component system response regulator YesN
MKCIIADDERLVRYSIQDMLEEIADAGVAWFDEICQAVNGKELLQQVSLRQPELVFVDIRMPLLNGLEAIEQGRILSPQTQWIILTGYAEFDYAKRAVALGALDYLLKPASKSDIERVVKLALSNVADKRAQEQLSLEHRLLGLLQDTFSEDPELPSDTSYTGMVLTLDSPMTLGQTNQFQKNAMLALRQWLRTAPEFSSTGAVALLDDGNMVCVVSSSTVEVLEKDGARLSVKCVEFPEHPSVADFDSGGQAKERGPALFTVFLLDKKESSLTALINALSSLSREAWLRLPGGMGKVIDASLRESLAGTYSGKRNLFASLDRAMRNRDMEPAGPVQLLKQNRSQLESCWPGSELCQYFELYSGLDLSQDKEKPALDQCMDWCSRNMLPDSVANESAKRRHLVQRAIDILAEQYTNEIGLAQVADLMGITPNYLSSEFNRIMGESFSQYVTKLRMKKAEELIRSGSLTVKEVAARVGYVSSRHFGSLFKKYYGHVPSEHVSR